jgi:hypothetical protein
MNKITSDYLQKENFCPMEEPPSSHRNRASAPPGKTMVAAVMGLNKQFVQEPMVIPIS